MMWRIDDDNRYREWWLARQLGILLRTREDGGGCGGGGVVVAAADVLWRGCDGGATASDWGSLGGCGWGGEGGGNGGGVRRREELLVGRRPELFEAGGWGVEGDTWGGGGKMVSFAC